MSERHKFQSYKKSGCCGFKIDAYARCGLPASASMHKVKAPQGKRQDWHDADCAQRFGRDPCDCNFGAPQGVGETMQSQVDEAARYRLDKAQEAISEAAEGIANCYCPEEDVFEDEKRRLIVEISKVVSQENGIVANFLQVGPGGICFVHGPFTTKHCPRHMEWQQSNEPNCPCATDSQKPEYIALANEQARHARVFTEADMDAVRESERERCAKKGFDAVMAIEELLYTTYPPVQKAAQVAAAIRANPITQATGGPQITTVPDHSPASQPHVFEPHDSDEDDSNYRRVCDKYQFDQKFHVLPIFIHTVRSKNL